MYESDPWFIIHENHHLSNHSFIPFIHSSCHIQWGNSMIQLGVGRTGCRTKGSWRWKGPSHLEGQIMVCGTNPLKSGMPFKHIICSKLCIYIYYLSSYIYSDGLKLRMPPCFSIFLTVPLRMPFFGLT